MFAAQSAQVMCRLWERSNAARNPSLVRRITAATARPAEFEPNAPLIGSWKTPEHAANESLDSAPVEPACETGAILTITDYDVRSLYLDLLRRNLTRYGMHERVPADWPLRRRLLLKTFALDFRSIARVSGYAAGRLSRGPGCRFHFAGRVREVKG